jgi:hypothetical protein
VATGQTKLSFPQPITPLKSLIHLDSLVSGIGSWCYTPSFPGRFILTLHVLLSFLFSVLKGLFFAGGNMIGDLDMPGNLVSIPVRANC